MPAVLVALGSRLISERLLPDVDRLRSAGLDLHLVSWAAPSPELATAVGDVVVLHAGAVAPPGAGDSENAAQELLDDADDSVSPGELEESLAAGESDGDAAELPRVKATGAARVAQVTLRAARNPRPYAARVYVLARRRARPLRRRVRRHTRGLRANLHRPRATAAFLRSDEVRRLIEEADVLIAVDSAAVFAVWTVVRKREDLLGVIGVDAALARLRATA